MSLAFDGRSQCLDVSGLPAGALTLTVQLAEPVDPRVRGCLCDARMPFGTGNHWGMNQAAVSEDGLTLAVTISQQSGALRLFADWTLQNAVRATVNSIQFADDQGNLIRDYQLIDLASSQVPDTAGESAGLLQGFSFNGAPNYGDIGYWYVLKAVSDGNGGLSVDVPVGLGMCTWYGEINNTLYAAVRLPWPRSDLTVTSDVTLDEVLSAANFKGYPFGRIEGS